MFVLVLFGIASAVVPHKSFHATIECRPIVLRSYSSSFHIIVVVVFLNDGREVVEQSRVIISQIKRLFIASMMIGVLETLGIAMKVSIL